MSDVVAMTTAYDFTATTLDGQQRDLADYRGRVLLIVNTASECGYTPQYEGLQDLHDKYADRGLVVLGFPCDQFGHQEPGDEAAIQTFCSLTYSVDFPMFAKVEVNGDDAHPLFQWLQTQASGPRGAALEWNFTKFLVGQDGQVVKRFSPQTEPTELVPDLTPLLPPSS
jgi:glutathione peroxidase